MPGNYGYSQSYGQSYGQNCQQQCQIPNMQSMIQVPHHIFTVHAQPVTTEWVEQDCVYNQIPSTQEVRYQAHPPQKYCVQKPSCQPACQPRCQPRCASRCGGGRGYGYGY